MKNINAVHGIPLLIENVRLYRQRMRTTCALLMLIFLALPATAAKKPELSGYAIALDADTLRIGTTRIRLYGVSAIEMKDGGHLARAAVDEVIAGKRVDCRKVDTDRYKRPVAICAIEDGPADLSEWLLATGSAVTYRAYMDQPDVDDGYLAAERVASEKGLGVWKRDTNETRAIFGGIFGIYHREFITGIIAIVAALLGACAGAYAGIFEIRRIRDEMKNERAIVTARLFEEEFREMENLLEDALRKSREPYNDLVKKFTYKNALILNLAKIPEIRTVLDQDMFRVGDFDGVAPSYILEAHRDFRELKNLAHEMTGNPVFNTEVNDIGTRAETIVSQIWQIRRYLKNRVKNRNSDFPYPMSYNSP